MGLLILGVFAWWGAIPRALNAQRVPAGPPVHITPGSVPNLPGGVAPQPAPPPPPPAPKVAPPALPGQLPQVPELTANVNLVLVPVVVTDPLNRMVTGLDKQFFTLSEDNVPQTITS
ncbi:MAG TPA: hypothetical protein VNE83_03390, partial [Terriglobales bacterium]|nr:hypothetical protein [Terriglobales bacterium]